MLKQSGKNEDSLAKQIQEDIQFLLSNIRARQNGLIFFLERFLSQCKTQNEFSIFKEEFLQKQKIYANQVARIVSKYSQSKEIQQQLQSHMRSFWIKVKSIVNVSLDRLKMLKLLNERIESRYDEMLGLIQQNYDEQKDLQQFSCIQKLLKKRNIDALIYSRNQFSSPHSDSKIPKNRSESAFKHSSKLSPKPNKYHQAVQQTQEINPHVKLKFDEYNHENGFEQRMKSLNRYRKKKIILESKNSTKNQQKAYKKMMKGIDKIHKCLEGAMECTIETNIDKKKSIKQNEVQMYDTLFNKNISNHKMISKFIYGTCGIAQLLINRKKMKAKKIFINKTDKNIRDSKEIDKKNKSKYQKDGKEEKEKQKHKEKENKQKEKDKQHKQRPQTSLPAHIKSIFEEEKRKMIQTTLILQDKKSSKYRRKLAARIEKYAKLVKIAA